MRNRLNVNWSGSRTTARFPDYLWRLALIASNVHDHTLQIRVRYYLESIENQSVKGSPSSFVVGFLADLVEEELTLARFNPALSSTEHQSKGARQF